MYVHHEGYHDVHNEFREWFWQYVTPFLLDQELLPEPELNDGFD